MQFKKIFPFLIPSAGNQDSDYDRMNLFVTMVGTFASFIVNLLIIKADYIFSPKGIALIFIDLVMLLLIFNALAFIVFKVVARSLTYVDKFLKKMPDIWVFAGIFILSLALTLIVASIPFQGQKSLEITNLKNYQPGDNLAGVVLGVEPADFNVYTYIHVPGSGWWIKPENERPATIIKSDGAWDCRIITGGEDLKLDKVAAFLIYKGGRPPLLNGAEELPWVLTHPCFLSPVKAMTIRDAKRIDILSKPSAGSLDHLRGKVMRVSPEEYDVLVYIYNNGWWNKPGWENIRTPIQSDLTWDCDIRTDPNDYSATQVAVFLVLKSYTHPTLAGKQDLPEDIKRVAMDYKIENLQV